MRQHRVNHEPLCPSMLSTVFGSILLFACSSLRGRGGSSTRVRVSSLDSFLPHGHHSKAVVAPRLCFFSFNCQHVPLSPIEMSPFEGSPRGERWGLGAPRVGMTLRTSSTNELPLAITKILASVQSDLLLGGTGPNSFTKKEPAIFSGPRKASVQRFCVCVCALNRGRGGDREIGRTVDGYTDVDLWNARSLPTSIEALVSTVRLLRLLELCSEPLHTTGDTHVTGELLVSHRGETIRSPHNPGRVGRSSPRERTLGQFSDAQDVRTSTTKRTGPLLYEGEPYTTLPVAAIPVRFVTQSSASRRA